MFSKSRLASAYKSSKNLWTRDPISESMDRFFIKIISEPIKENPGNNYLHVNKLIERSHLPFLKTSHHTDSKWILMTKEEINSFKSQFIGHINPDMQMKHEWLNDHPYADQIRRNAETLLSLIELMAFSGTEHTSLLEFSSALEFSFSRFTSDATFKYNPTNFRDWVAVIDQRGLKWTINSELIYFHELGILLTLQSLIMIEDMASKRFVRMIILSNVYLNNSVDQHVSELIYILAIKLIHKYREIGFRLVSRFEDLILWRKRELTGVKSRFILKKSSSTKETLYWLMKHCKEDGKLFVDVIKSLRDSSDFDLSILLKNSWGCPTMIGLDSGV